MFSFAPEFNRQSRFADLWNPTQTCCRWALPDTSAWGSEYNGRHTSCFFLWTLYTFTHPVFKSWLCVTVKVKTESLCFWCLLFLLTVSEPFWIWGTITFIHDQSLWQWVLVHYTQTVTQCWSNTDHIKNQKMQTNWFKTKKTETTGKE